MLALTRFDWDVKTNWDVIRTSMETLHLPIGLCNPKGIQAAQFKPCYGLLVLLFFLFHLGMAIGMFLHLVGDPLLSIAASFQANVSYIHFFL